MVGGRPLNTSVWPRRRGQGYISRAWCISACRAYTYLDVDGVVLQEGDGHLGRLEGLSYQQQLKVSLESHRHVTRPWLVASFVP